MFPSQGAQKLIDCAIRTRLSVRPVDTVCVTTDSTEFQYPNEQQMRKASRREHTNHSSRLSDGLGSLTVCNVRKQKDDTRLFPFLSLYIGIYTISIFHFYFPSESRLFVLVRLCILLASLYLVAYYDNTPDTSQVLSICKDKRVIPLDTLRRFIILNVPLTKVVIANCQAYL